MTGKLSELPSHAPGNSPKNIGLPDGSGENPHQEWRNLGGITLELKATWEISDENENHCISKTWTD